MPDYDISEAFARIENELISSMFRGPKSIKWTRKIRKN